MEVEFGLQHEGLELLQECEIDACEGIGLRRCEFLGAGFGSRRRCGCGCDGGFEDVEVCDMRLCNLDR